MEATQAPVPVARGALGALGACDDLVAGASGGVAPDVLVAHRLVASEDSIFTELFGGEEKAQEKAEGTADGEKEEQKTEGLTDCTATALEKARQAAAIAWQSIQGSPADATAMAAMMDLQQQLGGISKQVPADEAPEDLKALQAAAQNGIDVSSALGDTILFPDTSSPLDLVLLDRYVQTCMPVHSPIPEKILQKLHDVVVGKMWVANVTELQLKSIGEDPDGTYISLVLSIDGFPIVIPPHITISYNTKFADYHSLFRFRIQAKALLLGSPQLVCKFERWGRTSWNFKVPHHSELGAMCSLLQDLLPNATPPVGEVELHVTWTRSDEAATAEGGPKPDTMPAKL